jgi:hypothetical protein
MEIDSIELIDGPRGQYGGHRMMRMPWPLQKNHFFLTTHF